MQPEKILLFRLQAKTLRSIISKFSTAAAPQKLLKTTAWVHLKQRWTGPIWTLVNERTFETENLKKNNFAVLNTN